MTEPTAAQIGRLPVWAQTERAGLLARIAHLEAAYDAVMAGRLGPEGSNTFMRDENREGDLWLPDGARVSYRVGYGQDDVIHVHATAHASIEIQGMGPVQLHPLASNHLEVELRKW